MSDRAYSLRSGTSAPRPRRSRRRSLIALTMGAVLVGALLTALAVRDGDGGSPAPAPQAAESRVLLDESFDGNQLDPAKWNTCHWWNDQGCTIVTNDELEWYLPEQVAVSDGVLRLTAQRDEVRGSDGETYPFRSGMVTTGPSEYEGPAKVAWTYGTVEARIRVPTGRGLWPAMWMLPADSDSRPEIDIVEILGHDPGLLLMHLHPNDRDAASLNRNYRLPTGTFASDWHTVRLDWTPGRLAFFVDDRQVWTVSGRQVPDEPMYLLFNLAVGGVYPGDPDAATEFPATYEIDYVRVTKAE